MAHGLTGGRPIASAFIGARVTVLLALLALLMLACESGEDPVTDRANATATARPDAHRETATATPALPRTPAATASPMPTAAPRETASAPPAAEPAETTVPEATATSAPVGTPQATPSPAATPTPTSTSCSGLSCIEEAPGSFERKVWGPGETVDWSHGVFFVGARSGQAEGYRSYPTGTYNTGLGGYWVVAEAEETTHLLNRETGQAWRWSSELKVVGFSSDRLLLAEPDTSGAGERFYVLNATMEEQARFVIDVGDGWWPPRQPGYFGPGGRAVAFVRRSDSGDRVYVVDVETGQPTRIVQPVPPEGYSGFVRQLRRLSDNVRLSVVASYARPGVLSRVIEESWIVTWEGDASEPLCEGRLSPNGRYTAWMEGRPAAAKNVDQVGPEEPVPSVVIADAETCEPILRVRYAVFLDHGWEGQWLANSEGLVVRVEDGFAVVRPHTTPALIPLPAAPSAPPHSWGPLPNPYGGLFLYDLAGTYALHADHWVRFPAFDTLSLGDGVSEWGMVRWGSRWWEWDQEIQFITTDYLGEADVVWHLQPPVVELLAPVLSVVSEGATDALVLYWTGGPDNATTWQYRTRGPWYSGRAAWGEWTDIPGGDAATRSYRLTGLQEGMSHGVEDGDDVVEMQDDVHEVQGGMSYGVQVRGIVGTLAGGPSDTVWSEVPTLDTNGIPWLGDHIAEGGRAWRVGGTVVDIPAGMRVSARWQGPVDPMPSYEETVIVDVQSGSMLGVSTDFGAECWRELRTSAPGRDVNALFDQIIASARVQLDVPARLTVVIPGDRGVVSLRWFGAPQGVTHWEYRLRGPYPFEGPRPQLPWDDRPERPWGDWIEIPGSDADTRSHDMSGLPEGTAWGFQVRAVAGSTVGIPSGERIGAPAVVGRDGIPQLHGYSQWAGGGRTWRLGDSPTVIDVPVGLVVDASPPDSYPDGQISVSEQTTGHSILVDVEAATEMSFEGGIVSTEPPCGVGPPGLWQLFEHMRGSLRLQPIER